MTGRGLRLLTLLAACTGCYDASDPPGRLPADLPSATTTIAQLHKLYPGSTTQVNGEVVVRGKVTSSDRAGNFYRSFLVEADGAAVEVMAGTDKTCNRYPPGCRVALRLAGTAVGKSRGVLQIGRMPAPYASPDVDYFGSQAVLDGIVVRGEAAEEPAPALLDISELHESRCGCLVSVGRLHYVAQDEEQEEPVWSGYRRFENDRGGVLYVYTSPYARFADDPLPQGNVRLTGILQYGKTPDGDRFMLKLRDETDCTP